jgi:hypothetical protein
MKILFVYVAKEASLMRRSTVLSFSLQSEFPDNIDGGIREKGLTKTKRKKKRFVSSAREVYLKGKALYS